MYAADKTIREILPDLGIEARLPNYGFDPDRQIQPCSIDLRLDTHFWKARKVPRPPGWRFWRRPVLDIRNKQLQELAPRRRWKKVKYRPGEAIDLKPNEVLLGRTYEKFTVPPLYAGKIEGRSSYARLGLMIHCTGDFINPGWQGHMPVEIVSFARSRVRLAPLMPIAQLILIKLTEEPERHYGHQSLESKYPEDDGGPSYWWKDKLFDQIAQSIGGHNLHTDIRDSIAEQISPEASIESLERLHAFILKTRIGEIDSGTELMDDFAKSEDRRRTLGKALRASALTVTSLLGSGTIGSFFVHPIGGGHIALWLCTALGLIGSGFAFLYKADGYYGRAELAAQRVTLPQT
ncbi:dCTP deaminase [Streptomyces sp. NPDC048281]|uniref:dCTP deaminase n=1 Tax=Streptomyces sp. NPDC048281 TaxID=3154715 RepID=UPI003426E499